MKLVHPHITQHIDFNKNFAYTLVIENSNEFFNLTNQLINQIDKNKYGEFVLSENVNIIDISKFISVVFDYYNLIDDDKKIENNINKRLVSYLKKEDFISEFCDLNSRMNLISEKILCDLNLPIISTEGLTEEKFVKLMGYKLSKRENLIERIIDYISFQQEIKDIKVIVFINLSSVLNSEEINEIIKQLNYQQINILMIESQDKYQLNKTKKIIIDKDLCEI